MPGQRVKWYSLDGLGKEMREKRVLKKKISEKVLQIILKLASHSEQAILNAREEHGTAKVSNGWLTIIWRQNELLPFITMTVTI